MLNKKVEEAINKQINAELWSAYLYLSMSAYFESKNLKGFANWMRVQYQEEVTHAMKFFDYVNERGGRVKLLPIAEVKIEWSSAIDVYEETYKHECKVTELINNIANIALEEKDHATMAELQWFINEQVEEESNADNILQQLKLMEGNNYGLLMLDRELATRVFVDSTQTPAQ